MTLHNVLTPLEGRTRTQTAPATQYATRVRPDHWGTDLRAEQYNVPGDRVYAPADARVVDVGYGKGGRRAPIPWHSGRFVMLDLGVWGGDRMYVYLGHLNSTRVRPGQRIGAGHIIGTMGGSGAAGEDQFVVHLHLGVSVNAARPTGTFRAGRGWTDPVQWFARHGVNLNTTPKEDTLSAAEVRTINAHATEQADRVIRAVGDLRSDLLTAVRTTSQTSAWVIDPDTGEQVEVYLSGVLQRIDGKLSALVESANVDPARLATLNPAVKTVKEN